MRGWTILALLAAAPVPTDDAAVVRAALAATGRSACVDPDRQPGHFAASRAERARDDRGGKLDLWFRQYFSIWWQPIDPGNVSDRLSKRLFNASLRLWAQPADASVRTAPPHVGQPGPCAGVVAGAVEWMGDLAFVEVGEMRGPRDGHGTLWVFERDGKRWVPIAKTGTWVT